VASGRQHPETTLTVFAILVDVDTFAVNGVLYNGDKTLRNEAMIVFGPSIRWEEFNCPFPGCLGGRWLLQPFLPGA